MGRPRKNPLPPVTEVPEAFTEAPESAAEVASVYEEPEIEQPSPSQAEIDEAVRQALGYSTRMMGAE